MFGESYKLSAFYVVGPVAIDSEKITKPKRRVETVLLDSKQYEYKKVLKFETFIKEEDIDDEYTQRPDEDEDEDEDYGLDEEIGEEDYGSNEESDDGLDDLNSDLDLDVDLDAELDLDSDNEGESEPEPAE